MSLIDHLSPREKLLREFVSSEQTYVSNLVRLMCLFYSPLTSSLFPNSPYAEQQYLKNKKGLGVRITVASSLARCLFGVGFAGADGGGNGMVPMRIEAPPPAPLSLEGSFDQIFGGIEELLPLHIQLLEKLMSSTTTTTSTSTSTTAGASGASVPAGIGKIFIEFAPFLRVYGRYCSGYGKSSSLLRGLMGGEDEAAAGYESVVRRMQALRSHYASLALPAALDRGTGGIAARSSTAQDGASTPHPPYEHVRYASLNKRPLTLPEFLAAMDLDSAAQGRGAVHGDGLQSLLIMPIQRVPRYALLLRELLRLTPAEHSEYAEITEAHRLVSATAISLNGLVDRFERQSRVIEIERALSPGISTLVTPSREFVKEGFLEKLCGSHALRRPKRYYFALFSDAVLLYGEAARGAGGKVDLTAHGGGGGGGVGGGRREGGSCIKLHGILNVVTCCASIEGEGTLPTGIASAAKDESPLISTSPRPSSTPPPSLPPSSSSSSSTFSVLAHEKSFTVIASSPAECRAWMAAITRVTKEAAEASSSRHRASSLGHSRGAQWSRTTAPLAAEADLVPASSCLLCEGAFSFFRAHHICTTCSRDICGGCSHLLHGAKLAKALHGGGHESSGSTGSGVGREGGEGEGGGGAAEGEGEGEGGDSMPLNMYGFRYTPELCNLLIPQGLRYCSACLGRGGSKQQTNLPPAGTSISNNSTSIGSNSSSSSSSDSSSSVYASVKAIVSSHSNRESKTPVAPPPIPHSISITQDPFASFDSTSAPPHSRRTDATSSAATFIDDPFIDAYANAGPEETELGPLSGSPTVLQPWPSSLAIVPQLPIVQLEVQPLTIATTVARLEAHQTPSSGSVLDSIWASIRNRGEGTQSIDKEIGRAEGGSSNSTSSSSHHHHQNPPSAPPLPTPSSLQQELDSFFAPPLHSTAPTTALLPLPNLQQRPPGEMTRTAVSFPSHGGTEMNTRTASLPTFARATEAPTAAASVMRPPPPTMAALTRSSLPARSLVPSFEGPSLTRSSLSARYVFPSPEGPSLTPPRRVTIPFGAVDTAVTAAEKWRRLVEENSLKKASGSGPR